MSTILGHGGYGVVVSDASDPHVAHKLMRAHVTLGDAKTEFDNHRRIFSMWTKFSRDHEHVAVRVPKPMAFVEGSPRMYSMEKVVSTRPDGLAEHVLLNEDDPQFFGKVMFSHGPNVDVAHTISEQDKDEKRPRGAFLGPTQLVERGYDVYDLAWRMGILFELIESTPGMSAFDVEFVLGKDDALWAMDFGLCHLPLTPSQMGWDLYLPQPEHDPKLHSSFETGRSVVRDWLALTPTRTQPM